MRYHSRLKRSNFIVGVALICWLGGCRFQKHYALQGQVLGKSTSEQQITVNHGEIPGFMAAMSMPYPVREKSDFEKVQPGDRITADVVVEKDHGQDRRYWLENIKVVDASGRGSVSSLPPHQLLPGEAPPDLLLTNQDGKQIHLGDFKGKAVLLTFIYTRCPFPTFCPLVSSNFAAIQKELAKDPAEYAKTHLVSVSLDPAYDTPPVMRKYGLSYLLGDTSGFQHWDFVSTSPDDLKKLATAFGLEYFEQDNLISHSMETILLSRDGKVAETWPGSDWKTAEIVAALRQAADTPSQGG